MPKWYMNVYKNRTTNEVWYGAWHGSIDAANKGIQLSQVSSTFPWDPLYRVVIYPKVYTKELRHHE